MDEIDRVDKFIIGRRIGGGTFGNVFDCYAGGNVYALKLSKVFQDTEDEPSGKSNREVYIINHMIRFLRKKCPFFLYSRYMCTMPYTLTLKKETYSGPCIAILMEKARGTLAEYFSVKRTVSETVSSILQIAVAVHFLQVEYQLLLGDIKASNIVYMEIKDDRKNLWEGEILGKKVFIQNHGVMFFIIDFGVARSKSPRHPMFWKSSDIHHSLGNRLVYLDGKIATPFISGKGEVSLNFKSTHVPKVEFFMGRKGELKVSPLQLSEEDKKVFEKHDCPCETSFKFFDMPLFIPPIDFFLDCQDIIGMFLGAPRAAGFGGNHKTLSGVPESVKKFLDTLLWDTNYMPGFSFYYLAGYLTHVFQ